MDAQDWLDNCERTHREMNQLSSDVSGKNREGKMSSFQRKKYNKTLNSHRQKMKRLAADLKKQEKRGQMGAGEVARRQNLIGGLRKMEAYIEGGLDANSNARADLERVHRDPNRYEENARTQNLNQEQVLQQQEDQREAQDAKLDLLLSGVTTIKDLSLDVGAELGLHTALLDDIDTAHDRNADRLVASTQNVEALEESSTSCATYLCILFLFLLIIFLLSTNYACVIFNQSKC